MLTMLKEALNSFWESSSKMFIGVFSVNLSKSRRVKISDPEPGPVFGIEDLSVEPVLMSGDLPLFPSEVNQSTSDSNQRKVGKRTEEFQTPI